MIKKLYVRFLNHKANSLFRQYQQCILVNGDSPYDKFIKVSRMNFTAKKYNKTIDRIESLGVPVAKSRLMEF